MFTVSQPRLLQSLALAAATSLTMAACDTEAPSGPGSDLDVQPAFTTLPGGAEYHAILAELRRVTAPYHDLNAAIADGFVFRHGCEIRPTGAVGTVYVKFAHALDGKIDPSKPDGLLYEPAQNGRLVLTGVELAIPYALWTGAEPPRFLGATFQREDELGVFGLHAWIWRHNPDGMLAPANPRVSCDDAE
jgi:hypothetical protein